MAWNYTDTEYLKLYRKTLGWEWYKDVGTKVLFFHCLLRANWKAGSWKGIPYEAGQFITSISSLAEETGLSVKQVRVALRHLIQTGEVASKGHAKYSVITVKNWSQYQQEGKVKDTIGANKGQAEGNRYKKIRSKEDKKYIPPTKQDIEDYIFLRHFNNVDVDAFVDYNESLGWKMEWHKALDQWVENQKKRDDKTRSKNPFLNFKQRDYDFEAMERMMEDEDYDGSLEKYADDY